MSNDNIHFSDKALVGKILGANTQDFAIIVKNTERLVAQIVRKMGIFEEDQKDIVQDIYLKAYKNLPSFQFKSKLSTWIANIAYNTTVSYLQKKKVTIIGIEEANEGKLILSDNAELETIKSETVEILSKEIDKLPPLYKTLITLYHLEELPNKEIAAITNLPEGTIKSYLSRARKILKDNINHHYKK